MTGDVRAAPSAAPVLAPRVTPDGEQRRGDTKREGARRPR
jgi:hypothetical protein